jgi:Subtilase family
MDRYFYRRGERVPVAEVDGVLAVQVEESTSADAGDTDFGELAAGERAPKPALAMDEEEADALSRSGWIFVRPAPTTESARATREMPAGVQDVNAVYQQEDGHVLIGTQTITVQLSPKLSPEQARGKLEKEGLKVVRELRFAPNQFEAVIPAGADLLDVANSLQENPDTVYAEPTFVEFIGQRLRPTDPTYAQQWHLRNTGGSGGVAGADIAAERAWDFTRGAGVRLAVIDNGFDVAHRDLAPGIAAESGFFDAAGTFRRTLTSYPDNDHGTFCAGMAAARHNNSLDGCGSAPEVRLLLVATRGDQVGTQATLARGLAYAADPSMEVAGANPATGADVIASSLGPNGANWALTTVLQNAIVFAANRGRKGRGTPIFWATSNGNNVDVGLDQVVSHPDVIAVGRSRRNDTEDNSARGAQLDFLAPGVNVVSTGSGGGTRTDTGTSFAAPLSAGVGALVLAVNPELSARGVYEIIRDTCDKIGGVAYDRNGHNVDYGHGRVNAFRAVVRALDSLTANGVLRSDQDGDGVADIPVSSPWGIGTLKFRSGTLASPAMAPNGSRFNGWLLNTVDNRFPVMGDFDGDGKSELLVTSPWGIGVLKLSGTSYTALMLKPNGTRFGGWLLNTGDNRFGPVGDFDGDGKVEIVVRSPWGIGLLKLAGSSFAAPMMAPNGTRFGGWLLNTTDNRFGPVADYDGDGRAEMLIHSPWGIGILELAGGTFAAPMMARNGTRFGGWLLNTGDNWFGPAGDLDGDGKAETMIASPWGLGMLKLSGATMTAPMMKPNGTRFGGWLLNTFDNRMWSAADFDGDGRAELLISSPWGIGVLELAGSTLAAPMMKPNGTRFGGWLLNTGDNRFRRFQDLTGDGRADVLVESPWGIGIFSLSGATFTVPMMAPNGTRFGGWLLNTNDNRFY